jgi:hypothetical protein
MDLALDPDDEQPVEARCHVCGSILSGARPGLLLVIGWMPCLCWGVAGWVCHRHLREVN